MEEGKIESAKSRKDEKTGDNKKGSPGYRNARENKQTKRKEKKKD